MGEAEELLQRLEREAIAGGYTLNPNKEDTMMLVEGLLTNIKRYGYPSCPCRIADGRRELDLDIICPCDYRDADLSDYGACYCALYVTRDWIEGRVERRVVPERRPPREVRPVGPSGPSGAEAAGERLPARVGTGGTGGSDGGGTGGVEMRGGRLPAPPPGESPGGAAAGGSAGPAKVAEASSPLKGRYPVWRCRVCGYLCAREKPPQVCPICRATADRFERFS